MFLARKIKCDGYRPTCRQCTVRSQTCNYTDDWNALDRVERERSKAVSKAAAVVSSGSVSAGTSSGSGYKIEDNNNVGREQTKGRTEN